MSSQLKWYSKKSQTSHTFTSVKDGITYIENLSEELDSATVVLFNEEQYDFEPFDIVELTAPYIGTVTMLIDSFVKNKISFNPERYDYTIQLMSKTKELERTVLPNVSFTNIKNTKSQFVYQTVNSILSDYSPKAFIGNDNVFTQIYTNNLDVKYQTMNLPDMQMTKPTLRGCLDRILSIDNCICKLDGNNNITTLDLNKRGIELDVSQFNYNPENQSSNDYASATDNIFNNVTPIYLADTTLERTLVTEYTGFRTEEMLVTDRNGVLITQKPIYDIKNVIWCGTIKFNQLISDLPSYLAFTYNENRYSIELPTTGNYYLEVNITPFIVEIQEFNTKTYEEQKGYAYFTRGNNRIEGILDYKKDFLIENWASLNQILVNALKLNPRILLDIGYIIYLIRQKTGDSTVTADDVSALNLILNYPSSTMITINYSKSFSKSCVFQITYEAENEDIRIQSSKYIPETNENNIIIDNPGEMYVNIYQQGKLFNQKCNRLGNRVKEFDARYDLTTYIPLLSDYIGNYVLIRRELQIFDNFIMFHGTFTENYVNINYFTGINARKRSWNIISANEAFTKSILDKWYCEFSFSNLTKTGDAITNIDYIARGLLLTFKWTTSYINRVFIRNTYTPKNVTNTYVDGNCPLLECDLSTYISGNSLVYNFKMNDNFAVGLSINNPDEIGGMSEEYNKYANDNGFCQRFEYFLVDDTYNDGGQVGILFGNGSAIDESELDGLIELSHMKPRVPITNINYFESRYSMHHDNIYNHKDSREVWNANIQFELCSDTENIITGEKFLENCPLIKQNSEVFTRKVYVTDKRYKLVDREYNPHIFDIEITSNVTINSPSNYNSYATITFNFRQQDLAIGRTIVITNENNEMLLAIYIDKYVYDNAASLTLYLNMLRTRDRRIYQNKSLKY